MFSRKLLERVEGWRGNTTRWEETNYKGTTPVTKRLLQYWFYSATNQYYSTRSVFNQVGL
jgi:hypothetical protein